MPSENVGLHLPTFALSTRKERLPGGKHLFSPGLHYSITLSIRNLMRKNVWNATFLQAQNEAKAGAFFTHTSPSLGIKNHNPLNIRYVKANKWLGLSKTTPNVSGFCKFDCVDYGLRAAILLILTYIRKRGCVTPRQIITRWAPPSENDSQAYVRTVCSISHLASNEVLPQPSKACLTGEVDKLILLLMAMTCVECGIRMKEINQEEIRDGYEEWTHPLPSL